MQCQRSFVSPPLSNTQLSTAVRYFTTNLRGAIPYRFVGGQIIELFRGEFRICDFASHPHAADRMPAAADIILIGEPNRPAYRSPVERRKIIFISWFDGPDRCLGLGAKWAAASSIT